MVFCASVGVGATSIVGSITTGNTRPRASSHRLPGVTVSVSVEAAASHVACWATAGLHANP